MRAAPENRDLLTPAEVAQMLRVDAKTVTRWARAGRLSSVKTPGGHRRYSRAEVESFLRFANEAAAAAVCLARDNDYACTLPRHHDGDHVAVDSDGVTCHSWPQGGAR